MCLFSYGDSMYNLVPGTTYHYKYGSQVTTLMKGTSKQQSQMTITAQVRMEVLNWCTIQMKVRKPQT